MNEEKLVAKSVRLNLRRGISGNSLLLKLISFVYPFIWTNHVYIGPGNWVINSFDTTHEPTKKYVEENSDVVERIDLLKNEAFVRAIAKDVSILP